MHAFFCIYTWLCRNRPETTLCPTVPLISLDTNNIGSAESSRGIQLRYNLAASRSVRWLVAEQKKLTQKPYPAISKSPFAPTPPGPIYWQRAVERSEKSAARWRKRWPLCLSLCRLPVQGDWWGLMLACKGWDTPRKATQSRLELFSKRSTEHGAPKNCHFPRFCAKLHSLRTNVIHKGLGVSVTFLYVFQNSRGWDSD